MIPIMSLLSPKRLVILAVIGGVGLLGYKAMDATTKFIDLQKDRQNSLNALAESVSELEMQNTALNMSLESANELSARLLKQMKTSESVMQTFLNDKEARTSLLDKQINSLENIANGATNEDCINRNLPTDVIRLFDNDTKDSRKNSGAKRVCSGKNSNLDDRHSKGQFRCGFEVERYSRVITELQKRSWRM